MDLYGHLSLPARLANAVNSLAFYLWKTFWPVDLAFNYTLGELSVAAVIVPLVAIALITTLVIHRWRAAPYLAVGWFWFVGVLVPTLGLIQTGDQAHADRYSYLPHAGLFVAVVWGLYENLKPEWRAKMRIRGGTAAVLFALTLLAWIQTSYWRGPIPFWERTLAVVPHHVQGLQLYGEALTLAKKFDQAEPHLRKAVQLRPKDPGGHRKLAQFYFQQGKHPEALAALDTAIGLAPESATAHYDRALVLRESGRLTEAITWFEKAIALGLQPNAHMDALFHLGRVHSKLRQQDYAAAYYLKMLALDPRHYLARKNLAYAYMDLRKYVEAEREFTTLYQYNERDEDVIRSLRFLRNRK
jgi:tetratricopeptide (TPR) repeat protein